MKERVFQMCHYKTAKICLSGHLIDSNIDLSSNTDNFCSKCGESTITHCPHCKNPILGAYYDSDAMFIQLELPVPSYCPNCGKPYPWTERLLHEAEEIVSMADTISEEDIAALRKYMPDLLVEKPSTISSTLKVSQLLEKAGPKITKAFMSKLGDAIVEKAIEFLPNYF